MSRSSRVGGSAIAPSFCDESIHQEVGRPVKLCFPGCEKSAFREQFHIGGAVKA
jgi:hypothetical protein